MIHCAHFLQFGKGETYGYGIRKAGSEGFVTTVSNKNDNANLTNLTTEA